MEQKSNVTSVLENRGLSRPSVSETVGGNLTHLQKDHYFSKMLKKKSTNSVVSYLSDHWWTQGPRVSEPLLWCGTDTAGP